MAVVATLPRRGALVHHWVYGGVVARTNIVIDDDLVAKAMKRYGLTSKRAAVELALRRLVGDAMDRNDALTMEGSGWEGDLDEMRRSKIEDLGWS